MSRPGMTGLRPPSGIAPPSQLDRARLLVAGSHRILLDALVGHLEDAGAQVVTVTQRAEEMRALLPELRPDVCIVEHWPGGQPLHEIASWVHDAAPDVKLLALSHRTDSAVRSGLDAGSCDAVLSGECDLPLLRGTLADLLGGRTVSPQADLAPSPRMAERLTAREGEVLRLLSAGGSNAEIGVHLGISVNTVRTHVQSVLRKRGVPQRVQAAEIGGTGDAPLRGRER